MTKMASVILLLAGSLVGHVIAAETAGSKAAGSTLYFSSDSEKFTSRRIGAEFMTNFSHLEGKTGVRYTDYYFEKNDWSRQGQQLNIMHANVDKMTRDGWMIDAGLFRQNAHDLVTFDTSYRKTLRPQVAVELFAARDYIETATALDNGSYFSFAGASTDFLVTPKITVVGLLGQQSFSDGNRRNHARTRLIYQPNLDLGLTLQARYRYFDSSKSDVGGAYFNPDRYDESMLAVGWRQRVGNWRTNLTAGIGSQQINSDPHSTTKLLEAGAEKQERSYAVRVRGGYSRSASYGGPDYRYSYLSSELLIPF